MKKFSRWLAFGLALAAASVVIGATAAGSAKGPVANPDAGRSDADRAAIYASMRAEFDARYAAWMASLNTSQIDFNALPHAYLNAQVVLGEPTLKTAVSHADRIVVGSVVSLQPTIGGTMVTVRVDRTIKGEASASVVIRQSSGLRPTSDWHGMFIADSPGEPLLLPGKRFELFLQIASDGVSEIQSVTGMYDLAGGRVRALDLNPFRTAVNGLGESQFAATT